LVSISSRAASRLGALVNVLAAITPALFTSRLTSAVGAGDQRNRSVDLHGFPPAWDMLPLLLPPG
jgi:hypothetical protein